MKTAILRKLERQPFVGSQLHLHGPCRQLVVRQADRSYLFRALKHQLEIDLEHNLKMIHISHIAAVICKKLSLNFHYYS